MFWGYCFYKVWELGGSSSLATASLFHETYIFLFVLLIFGSHLGRCLAWLPWLAWLARLAGSLGWLAWLARLVGLARLARLAGWLPGPPWAPGLASDLPQMAYILVRVLRY